MLSILNILEKLELATMHLANELDVMRAWLSQSKCLNVKHVFECLFIPIVVTGM